MSRTLTAAIAALTTAVLPISAPAAPAPKPYADAVTHHAMLLHGKSLTYTARAGTIGIRDDKDKVAATMFYTAFTLDGASPAKRPITFLYNGGPGSSTIWLRMGSFGPVRVVTSGPPTGAAPFRLVANQQTLLDVTDLVFVDIADSGFGRIAPGADVKKYFSTDGDTAAFAQFIERYLNAFGRWNSPKFLFGESYGTARSALLSNYLQNANVGINGIVLQSSLLDASLATPYDAGGADTDDWQYVFWLPTLAATAYHYHMVAQPPATLAAFVGEASRFAMGEYREALTMGSKLPAQRRAEIVRKLAALHGSFGDVHLQRRPAHPGLPLRRRASAHSRTRPGHLRRAGRALDARSRPRVPCRRSDQSANRTALFRVAERLSAHDPSLQPVGALSRRRVRADSDGRRLGLPP